MGLSPADRESSAQSGGLSWNARSMSTGSFTCTSGPLADMTRRSFTLWAPQGYAGAGLSPRALIVSTRMARQRGLPELPTSLSPQRERTSVPPFPWMKSPRAAMALNSADPKRPAKPARPFPGLCHRAHGSRITGRGCPPRSKTTRAAGCASSPMAETPARIRNHHITTQSRSASSTAA